jgi:Family of unknown function (DUF6159)
MDRIARTWSLMGRSFAVLKSDRELVWLPIFSGIAAIAASILVFSGGALVFLPQLKAMGAAGARNAPMTGNLWVWLFVFYLVNYFIVVFFNVALVSVAGDRLAGGRATIDDGLQLAWNRMGKIFQWALLAATVGILLRMLEERVGWLGRLIVSFVGIAWTLATYFVVPILAAEDLGPVEALSRSGELFRERWGEEVVGGFSFGLIFTLLALPGIALPLYGATFGRTALVAGLVLALLYWILLGVVNAAVQGIFMAALYRYATTGNVPGGFGHSDLAGAWQPKE